MTTTTRTRNPRLARTSQAWPAWGEQLTSILAQLRQDQYLIVSAKQGRRFVQFAAQGADGLRAEAVSNAYLNGDDALEDGQVAALLAAGWNAPTGTPEEATPENDPDGSSNFYRDYAAPVPFEAVAMLAVRTFADILGVPDPGCLQYHAFETQGEGSRPLDLPGLGLKRVDPQEADKRLSEQVLETIRQSSGLRDLAYDDDGDLVVRYGGATVLVRPIEAASVIRLYAPLLEDVDKRLRLLDRLNGLNSRGKLLRFVWRERSVYLLAEVIAFPFVAVHLAEAFEHCCLAADGIAPLLRAEFGDADSSPAPGALLH